MKYEEVSIHGEEFRLYPQKVSLWVKKKILLIADLHFGKINHFRKAGIPVPGTAVNKNWEMLIDILRWTTPARVLFLGDLFHSGYNQEWEEFGNIVRHFPEISFELVRGNHDILSDYQYEKLNVKVHENDLIEQPFIFTHHPMESVPADMYNLSGHIHPAVRIRGTARQAMTLPCFFFSMNKGLLPAFGNFTGLAKIKPGKKDRVYVILEDQVLAV